MSDLTVTERLQTDMRKTDGSKKATYIVHPEGTRTSARAFPKFGTRAEADAFVTLHGSLDGLDDLTATDDEAND